MSASQIEASLTVSVRDAPDADDASLDVGRRLCCTMQAAPGKYDSIVVLCDRGEYEAVAYEFVSGSPALHFWVGEHSCITVEVWSQGRVIAAGIWQVGWLLGQQGYVLQTICSTKLEINQPEERFSSS